MPELGQLGDDRRRRTRRFSRKDLLPARRGDPALGIEEQLSIRGFRGGQYSLHRSDQSHEASVDGRTRPGGDGHEVGRAESVRQRGESEEPATRSRIRPVQRGLEGRNEPDPVGQGASIRSPSHLGLPPREREPPGAFPGVLRTDRGGRQVGAHRSEPASNLLVLPPPAQSMYPSDRSRSRSWRSSSSEKGISDGDSASRARTNDTKSSSEPKEVRASFRSS